MKKAYFKPQADVIDIPVCQPLLTGSVLGTDVFSNPADPDLPTLAPGMTIPGLEIPGLEHIPGGGF